MVKPSPGRLTPRGRAALGAALLAYYLTVVLLHDAVQRALVHLFDRWTFWGYEWRLLLVWTALFGAAGAWVALRLWRQRRRRLLLAWLLWLAVVTLLDHLVLFSQSERVHYPQYALLAAGLRLLLRTDPRALFAAAALGALDEGYQAAVLYRNRPELPFDFKDVGLNTLGAAGGLLVLRALRGRPPQRSDDD